MGNPFNFTWLLLIVLVSGCSTIPKTEVNIPESGRQRLWEARQIQLTQFNDWQLEGRLGLRVPGQSGSMSMEWRQVGEAYTVYLDGPLGQSIAKIEGKPERVQLEASGERYKGQSPEQLLFELTGWNLPVSLLRYWVMGMPSPVGYSTLKLNNQGNPSLISQQGWTVEYLQYKDFSGVTMPSRLKIRQGEVQATLVARSWRLK